MTDNLLKHLDEIKALHEAATEGPWEGLPDNLSTNYFRLRVDPTGLDSLSGYCGQANGKFIVRSRTDVPRMERLIRAQQRVIEALRNASGFYQFPSLGNRIGPVREAESAIAALIEKEWA